jgi:hypothetical protein
MSDVALPPKKHGADTSKASRPLQSKGRAAFAVPLMCALDGALRFLRT